MTETRSLNLKKNLPIAFIFIILLASTVRLDAQVNQLNSSYEELETSLSLLSQEYVESQIALEEAQKAYANSSEGRRYTGNPFTTQLWPGQLQCENITGMHWYTWYNGVQYNLTDTFLQVMYDMPLSHYYYRVFDNGLIYHFNSTWVAINVHEDKDGFSSMFGIGRPVFPNVTVEWYAAISTPGAGKDLFPGGLENWHGRAAQGIATFRHNGTDYEAWSSYGGSYTGTKLAGQDWTARTKFKIEYFDDNAGDWDIKYYVDDVLEATHDGSAGDNTPEGVGMCIFFEVGHTGTPATESLVYSEWKSVTITEGSP